jgi:hypothetical protein
MLNTVHRSSLRISRLIFMPAIVTLGITFLRLGGELAHWSPRFFNTAPGGGGALVGISWLPFLFGPYFAVKLAKDGQGAESIWKAFGLSALGIVIAFGGGFLGFAPQINFPMRQILGMLLIILGPSLLMVGWPALFKTLIAYAYAARIPVVLIMFFAIRGQWGTHYDAVPPRYAGPESLLAKYFFIGVVPQMLLWIAFTILVGAFVGCLVTAFAVRRAPAPQNH